ncbi:MAG: hypothetical protein ABIN97_02105 [Ginsengibacter sp.]
MMKRCSCVILIFLLHYHAAAGQTLPINRQLFFLDETPIEVTLTTDIKKLRNDKKTPVWQTTSIIMQFSDTSIITEQIRVKPRGIYRKNNCDIAALMLDFKNASSPGLSPLKSLKLVGGCHSNASDEALLIKEYLAYKIYNFISIMSFRVRLMHVTYKDSKQKVKPYSQYAFLIEDIKDLADRNNCVEIKNKTFNTEATNRQHINLVSIFQYMIGNTDWSVPVRHNIKLMVPKNDTFARPYPVAYDFDYAGLVNASYAVPDETLGTTSVTERVYRGFGRNMDELQTNLDIFKEKKEQIMFYIKNFTLLSENNKKGITRYLEDFYKIIDTKKSSKTVFIDNARKE